MSLRRQIVLILSTAAPSQSSAGMQRKEVSQLLYTNFGQFKYKKIQMEQFVKLGLQQETTGSSTLLSWELQYAHFVKIPSVLLAQVCSSLWQEATNYNFFLFLEVCEVE